MLQLSTNPLLHHNYIHINYYYYSGHYWDPAVVL